MIVHQTEQHRSRVSFDLSRENVAEIVSADEEGVKEAAEEVFHDNAESAEHSIMSSCHSSKCCCSSYVCSVCSPQGSMDNVNNDSASSSGINSIDIASPRLQQKQLTMMTSSASAVAEISKQSADDLLQQQPLLSKITQTEDAEEEEVVEEATEAKSDDNPEAEEAKNGKKGKKSKTTTHRILINLDDKNRFTDEITV